MEGNPSKLSYIHKSGTSPLVYRTLGQQLSIVAKEDGDREAFVFVEENKMLTYKELLSEADHLAAGLKCLGLCKGDRVGILAPNISLHPLVMYAAARAGLIAAPINAVLDSKDIANYLNEVTAKVLFTSEMIDTTNYYEKLLEIVPEMKNCNDKNIQCKQLPFLTTIIIDSDTNYVGAHRLKDVMSLATSSQIKNIEEQQKDISPESGCNIRFTSGSTGRPKGVLMNHLSTINTGFNTRRLELYNARMLSPLPFCFIYSLSIAATALCNNATVIVSNFLYDPEKILKTISNEKCTVILGVPKLYIDLVGVQRKLQLDISNLVHGITSGAPCTPQLSMDIKKELGMKRLTNAFGMTEYHGVAFISYPQDTDGQILDSVGCVMGHLEVKVVDDNGKLVPFGAPGELCIRGYSTMMCYWGNEMKTQEVLGQDGWLKTGDYFILHPNGYGKIIGRISDIIRKGTMMIFPQEIENLLGTHPSIAEVHIVGVPDVHWGEEICAFVCLREGFDDLTPKEIDEFCQGKISKGKIPRYIQLVKYFPRTLAGKIKKLELKESFVTNV